MNAVLLLLLLAAPPSAPDTVVVCPDEFRAALQPWVEHRRQQGHALAIVPNTGGAEEIRGQIRAAAALGRLRFVVLVGDATPLGAPAQWQARCVPTHYAKAKVNVLWGSEPEIATDNWYADLNDDQIPEVAVGRLTAPSAAALQQIVAKIIAYERSTDCGAWRRRLSFVAGVGGFGPLADAVLESAARYFLTENIPPAYQVAMTYGSWQSPYCPDPSRFHQTAIEQLNEGSLFWAYIGHGNPYGLDRLRVPGGEYDILGANDVPELRCRHAAPIALFLACYTGAIDAPQFCLGERMLWQPGGPVAVIAGSRVTMPYGMTALSIGLMDEIFRRHCQTVGEALLHAKQKMLQEPAAGDRQRQMIDTIASAVSPAPQQLADERAEHVLLFNLLGDPLLRLRYPRAVELEVPATVAAGTRLRIAGTCPIAGRATVELAVCRGRFSFKPPPRREYPQTPGGLAEFQALYRKANDPRLSSAEFAIAGNRFETQLDVPAEASGECQVCVFVEGNGEFALGAAAVRVRE